MGARIRLALWLTRFDAVYELHNYQFVAEEDEDPKTGWFSREQVENIPLNELQAAAERLEEVLEILNKQLMGLTGVVEERARQAGE